MEIYKYTNVQSGYIEYSACEDKYQEERVGGLVSKESITVIDTEWLEQPPVQEKAPACYKHGDEPKRGCSWCDKRPSQRRTWVDLTSEEDRQIKEHCTTVACVLKAVKAKLKEKNT